MWVTQKSRNVGITMLVLVIWYAHMGIMHSNKKNFGEIWWIINMTWFTVAYNVTESYL